MLWIIGSSSPHHSTNFLSLFQLPNWQLTFLFCTFSGVSLTFIDVKGFISSPRKGTEIIHLAFCGLQVCWCWWPLLNFFVVTLINTFFQPLTPALVLYVLHSSVNITAISTLEFDLIFFFYLSCCKEETSATLQWKCMSAICQDFYIAELANTLQKIACAIN